MHLSIVQTLPSEVIHEIYGYFATPMYLWLYKPNNFPEFPWYLGQICASWRAIFNSMSSNFWNKLDIHLERQPCTAVVGQYFEIPKLSLRYDLMLLMLRHFLDRTRGQPFSFRIKAAHILDREEPIIVRLLELLVAESPRWREAYFNALKASYIPILYQVKHHLPLLKTLELDLHTCEGVPAYTYDLFEDAPHLKCVDLGHLADWQVNWAALTILKIGDFFTSDNLLSILGQAERLENLAIYQSLDETSALDQMISLPNLKVLTTIGFRLLSVLHTPSLEELYIEDFDELSMSYTIVISFLNRSSCRLSRLGMGGCSAASLMDILQHTPDLVHLNLDNGDDMVMSFGHLTFHRQRDTSPLAHHLRSLTIMDASLSDMEIMELAALVTSRTKGAKASSGATTVEKLQTLSILTSEAPVRYNQRAAVESLRKQCAEQGVEFTVQPKLDISWPHHDNTSIRDW